MFHVPRRLLLQSVVALCVLSIILDGSLAQDDETCSADDASCQAGEAPKKKVLCKDNSDHCEHWASVGECTKNPGFMNVDCRKSCELCSDQKVRPILNFNELSQAADMGVPQTLENIEYNVGLDDTAELIISAREYMETTQVSKDIKELCLNEKDLCAVWTAYGECEKNQPFMKKHCAPMCHSCEYLSIEGRCPIDPDAPTAWGPGDLDKMFTKLTTEPYLSEYEVEILSSPTTGGPWVITMENVVSEEEAVALIELGATEGYKRSADVGKIRADGTHENKVNDGRTSTNAWCQSACYESEPGQKVANRLSNLTDILEPNSEYLQLLRYEPGQHYQVHHDYIEHHLERQEGVRILTLYLYLNEVEAGGGTNFDKLDITVMPKRGRALLWPSVFDDKPNEKDDRTTHQALPTEAGIKYGANAWFHMHDFKAPHAIGCH